MAASERVAALHGLARQRALQEVLRALKPFPKQQLRPSIQHLNAVLNACRTRWPRGGSRGVLAGFGWFCMILAWFWHVSPLFWHAFGMLLVVLAHFWSSFWRFCEAGGAPSPFAHPTAVRGAQQVQLHGGAELLREGRLGALGVSALAPRMPLEEG